MLPSLLLPLCFYCRVGDAAGFVKERRKGFAWKCAADVLLLLEFTVVWDIYVR